MSPTFKRRLDFSVNETAFQRLPFLTFQTRSHTSLFAHLEHVFGIESMCDCALMTNASVQRCEELARCVKGTKQWIHWMKVLVFKKWNGEHFVCQWVLNVSCLISSEGFALVPAGQAACHLMSSRLLVAVLEGSLVGGLTLLDSVSLFTCWFLTEHHCLFVQLCLFLCVWVVYVCAHVCVCVQSHLCTSVTPPPPAGSVSCACCADNQCVTLAGSVQQEQGTVLVYTHTYTL